MPKSKVTMCGEQFTIVNYTRPNAKRAAEIEQEFIEKAKQGEADDHDRWAAMMQFLLEGNTQVITPDTVDGRLADEVIMDFLPESKKMALRLLGS